MTENKRSNYGHLKNRQAETCAAQGLQQMHLSAGLSRFLRKSDTKPARITCGYMQLLIRIGSENSAWNVPQKKLNKPHQRVCINTPEK
jgi:hypothetical protein